MLLSHCPIYKKANRVSITRNVYIRYPSSQQSRQSACQAAFLFHLYPGTAMDFRILLDESLILFQDEIVNVVIVGTHMYCHIIYCPFFNK